MNVSEAMDQVCVNPLDKLTWGEWKNEFKAAGVLIVDDDSGFLDDKVLSALEARAAITRCTTMYEQPSESFEQATFEIVKPESKKMTIGEWRKAYDEIRENPPIENFVRAESGPIRLEVELHPGNPPFIFTRLYIRNIVGVEPAWFAQGKDQTNSFGWKVVLLPKSRDDVIKKYGVKHNVIFVKTLRILKMSASKRSLLAEVCEFVPDSELQDLLQLSA